MDVMYGGREISTMCHAMFPTKHLRRPHVWGKGIRKACIMMGNIRMMHALDIWNGESFLFFQLLVDAVYIIQNFISARTFF